MNQKNYSLVSSKLAEGLKVMETIMSRFDYLLQIMNGTTGFDDALIFDGYWNVENYYISLEDPKDIYLSVKIENQKYSYLYSCFGIDNYFHFRVTQNGFYLNRNISFSNEKNWDNYDFYETSDYKLFAKELAKLYQIMTKSLAVRISQHYTFDSLS